MKNFRRDLQRLLENGPSVERSANFRQKLLEDEAVARVVTLVHVYSDDEVPRARKIENFVGLVEVQCQWLFDHHVSAVLKGTNCRRVVKRIRCRHVEDAHLMVREDTLPWFLSPVRLRPGLGHFCRVALAESLGGLWATSPDRDEAKVHVRQTPSAGIQSNSSQIGCDTATLKVFD